MTNYDTTVRALVKQGKTAMKSINNHGAKSRDEWIKYGAVLVELRELAGGDDKAFGALVDEHGLNKSPAAGRAVRSDAMWLSKFYDRVSSVCSDIHQNFPTGYRREWRTWLVDQVKERQEAKPKPKVTDIIKAILQIEESKSPAHTSDDFYRDSYAYVMSVLEKEAKKAEAAKQAAEDGPGEAISDAPVAEAPSDEAAFWAQYEALQHQASEYGVEISAADAGALDRRRKKGGDVKKAAALATAAVKSLSRFTEIDSMGVR